MLSLVVHSNGTTSRTVVLLSVFYVLGYDRFDTCMRLREENV